MNMIVASSVGCLCALCLSIGAGTRPIAAASPGAPVVTIAIVGDSTVASYAAEDPHRGWGQLLPEFVNPAKATIQNFAVCGRSTKTFKSEGRWTKVLASRPTYILIQFGHNDSHAKDLPESTDADTDYSDYLRGYIDSGRDIGANVILVTPMHRGTWIDDSHLTQELLPYAAAMRRVATEKSVPVVDLYSLSEAEYTRIGKEQLDTLFAHPPTDRTHFNEQGARLFAEMVARQCALLVPDLGERIVLAR